MGFETMEPLFHVDPDLRDNAMRIIRDTDNGEWDRFRKHAAAITVRGYCNTFLY
jgi:hypothetical protein